MLVEEEIVNGLKSKNKEINELAFDKLYQKYYRLVFFIVGKYVSLNEDKEDLVQSIFLKIFQNRKKIMDYKQLSSYISSIAKNEAINFAKKNSRIVNVEDVENLSSDYNIVYVPELCKYLKKEDANIVILKVYYEYKFHEIAELLSIPAETVATRYYRALEVLKKYYEK